MLELAKYTEKELLRGGRSIEIRAICAADRTELLSALYRSSPQSLYRRFFAPKRGLTEGEIAYFLNVDFITHVAVVATLEEQGQSAVVGGGRYILVGPNKAEIAFAVVDQYQGQGIGAALMRHLAAIARTTGLEELSADVLADNVAMLKVFASSGLAMRTTRERDVVHVALLLRKDNERGQDD